MQQVSFGQVWTWVWLGLGVSLWAASSVRRWSDAWRLSLARVGLLLLLLPFYIRRPLVDGMILEIMWLVAITAGVVGATLPRFPTRSRLPLGLRGLLAGLSLGVLLMAPERGIRFGELLVAAGWWINLYGSIFPAMYHELRSAVSTGVTHVVPDGRENTT